MRKSIFTKFIYIFTCLYILSSCGKPETAEIGNDIIHITVSTYAKNDYLEEAAKQYMKTHSNIEIEIITFAPDKISDVIGAPSLLDNAETGDSAEKYIKNVNASLMGGKGFDIINMDVLPYYRYVESGFLENLELFMNNDPEFDKNDFYSGILDAMRFKDGIYMLPVNYISFVVQVNSNYESNVTGKGVKISEIVDAGAKELGESKPAYLYLYSDVYSLFNIIYEGRAESFLNFETKESNFNSPEFIGMLEMCKSFIDSGIVPDTGSNAADENEYYFRYDSIWTQDMLMPYFGFNDVYGPMAPLLDEEGRSYFKCPHAFAISESSEYKQECWNFLKFLASEQAQSTPGVFPINKSALKNGFSNQISQILDDAVKNGIPINADIQQIADEYISKIESWSEEATSYHYDDPIINSIINTEIQAFFEGRQDSKNTAEKIDEKVSTYLKE